MLQIFSHLLISLFSFFFYQTFVLITKKKDIFRFSATDAMWCLSPFNPVRRVAIAILTHGLFSLIIISTILANCYQMIMPATPVMESTELVGIKQEINA